MHEEQRPRVLLLDPACGTGTFLYTIINSIRDSYRQNGNAGLWSVYVREHLLPRLFGFELLMAPYAMAHLKLGMQLAALDLPDVERTTWAYDFKSRERLGVYLTNALEEAVKRSELLFARTISDEANAAAEVKRDARIMVVLGNPPYSGHSANRSWETKDGKKTPTFIGKLLQDYYKVDGQPLNERNPKWLQDDYVKFIRFAQWRIERTGHGILAFVTNHSYLDNPTFRGMRQSLMHSFDEIYVLNLHGNSKKQEKSPDGTKDENVFDIQQGVAIGIFVRSPGPANSTRQATVHYADLWGPREIYHEHQPVAGKYHWLAENDLETTQWTKLEPQEPFYLFLPQNVDLRSEYEQGKKITDIMPINVLGFQTHRDHFAIDIDRNHLYERINEMRDTSLSNQEYLKKYDLSDSSSWQLTKARRRVSRDPDWQTHFIRCLYRPFDWRFCYFNESVVDRPRPELQQHMLQPNLSLNVTRQTKADTWRHAVVANSPTPALYTEIKDGSNAFPLYLYPDPNKKGLFDTGEASNAPRNRHPNLAPDFVTVLQERLNMKFTPDGKGDLQRSFGPEDVFDYMYAVFHSPAYRERYAEFLKTDFPHLPLTSKADLFRDLCRLGERIVRLHLMEQYGKAMPKYPVSGSNVIERVAYAISNEKHKSGQIWINNEQYFEGITVDVWKFYVGGYQVCQKWLKDRKGRALSFDDIRHYQRTVAALAETIAIMEQIDITIDEHGGWPLT
jgi:predicted helicase